VKRVDRRLVTALLLLLLAGVFFAELGVALGGDSEAEPFQWLMGVLCGLCVVGAIAALVWPDRRP
jgi:hypothetical protein